MIDREAIRARAELGLAKAEDFRYSDDWPGHRANLVQAYGDIAALLDAVDEAERREPDDLDEFIREQADSSPDFALHLLNADLKARAEAAEARLEEATALLRDWLDGDVPVLATRAVLGEQ